MKTSSPEQPLKIGYVGRIVQEQKRVMDFVPLAGELAKRGVSFELKIIGDGPDRTELQNAFIKAGLADFVQFAGWLTPARVKEQLRGLDVFALLSDYEGLPVALLEAMAFGVAPVVTKTESGNTQLVRDGENGCLVAVGDIKVFSDHLESFARDRDKLISIGRRAWQTSQQYSIETMADNYVAAITETVQKASLRRERQDLTADYPVMSSCRSKYPFWLRKIKQRVSSLAS